MIQDLSFPRNHPLIQSVNAGIDSNEFPTVWGSFEAASKLILTAGSGPLIKWVNDFFVVQVPGAAWTEDVFISLTAASQQPWGCHGTPRRFVPSRRHNGDIRWVLNLLDITPNEIPLMPSEPTDIDWWGDASTSFGIGVTVGSLWAVWMWRDGIKVGPKQHFDIAWAEAMAIELAFRLALDAGLLCPGHYLVRSDNAGNLTDAFSKPKWFKL
ncbi:hypothetical protein NLJ89_g7672 [Agrocybe chaxingu]|uniref:Uncharacterized protein n=1 Tax=Agrocybe chaxingu TaxID=84603 RepID=A0A9W8MTG4_9AGAR|nr:hypothetical protein NLJ89_g7672 [Agrocybe chaxingu]